MHSLDPCPCHAASIIIPKACVQAYSIYAYSCTVHSDPKYNLYIQRWGGMMVRFYQDKIFRCITALSAQRSYLFLFYCSTSSRILRLCSLFSLSVHHFQSMMWPYQWFSNCVRKKIYYTLTIIKWWGEISNKMSHIYLIKITQLC